MKQGVGRQKRLYRADVDGLRAIAVTGVFSVHFDAIGIFPGGFLGVDVFFVISGFVIFRSMLARLEEKSFSLASFFAGRVRRLFPALLAMVTVTFAGLLFLGGPSQIEKSSISGLFSIAGISNFYFFSQDSYWAQSHRIEPFLHTWSLGVEEQFYIVFPILVLLFFGRLTRLQLGIGILSVAFLSFLTGVHFSSVDPEFSFYSPFTRFWEFLVGALLALYRPAEKSGERSFFWVSVGTFGLALILGGYVLASSSSLHPGDITLLPVVGTAFFILAGEHTKLFRALFSKLGLVATGRLSYSLYLWHYPALALARIRFEELSLLGELVVLGVVVVLSLLSYRYIEKPFRKGGKLHHKWFLALIPSSTVLVVLALILSVATQGYLLRPTIPRANSVSITQFPDTFRTYGEPNARAELVLVGDSHAGKIADSLGRKALESGFSFSHTVRSRCPMVLGLGRFDSPDWEEHKSCSDAFQRERLSTLEGKQWPIVVLASYLQPYLNLDSFDNFEGGVGSPWPTRFAYSRTEAFDPEISQESFILGLEITISALLKSGNRVVFVYPVPEVGWNVPDEAYRRSFLQLSPWPLDNPVTTKRSVYENRVRKLDSLMEKFNSDPNFLVVQSSELFCEQFEQGRCLTHNSSDLFYEDDNHLNKQGAEILSAKIMSEIELRFASG